MSLLTRMGALVEDPYSRAREETERGRRVVGITPKPLESMAWHSVTALGCREPGADRAHQKGDGG